MEADKFLDLIRHLKKQGTSFTTFNPFVPNAPFIYALKTSEKIKVFWYFQEIEKGCIGNELVKVTNWKHENSNFRYAENYICGVSFFKYQRAGELKNYNFLIVFIMKLPFY